MRRSALFHYTSQLPKMGNPCREIICSVGNCPGVGLDKSLTLMDHIHQKAVNMQEESVYAFSFQGPERPAKNTRLGSDSFKTPGNVIFQSPFATGDAAARKSPDAPQRPFTIYIGREAEGKGQEYLPDMPKLLHRIRIHSVKRLPSSFLYLRPPW
jgi:hypothetical protein